MNDHSPLEVFSGVKIDKRELQILRGVHNGIMGPLRSSLKTILDERGFEKAAFQRIELFVATIVECARDSLLLVQAQGSRRSYCADDDVAADTRCIAIRKTKRIS